MTREEAKRILYVYRAMNLVDGSHREAFDMAIKALEQEPCEDCISRQAAIDAIMANNIWENEYNLTSSRIKKAVEALPPVTPQCKSEDVAKAFQLGLAFGFGEKYDEMDKVMEEVKKAVTPQQKIGRWIDKDGISDFMYCSNCGGKKHYSEKWIGCPYCLADMRESYKEESEDK